MASLYPIPVRDPCMAAPGFSWIDRPHLAALAMPESAEDLAWLRRQSIQVLISLTETPLPRHWVNDAGLMSVNVPVPDMEPPSDRQLDHILETIRKANEAGMGVAIHCAAGLGRTDAASALADELLSLAAVAACNAQMEALA